MVKRNDFQETVERLPSSDTVVFILFKITVDFSV